MLPRVHVANFKHRVPRMHRRRSERIPDTAVALHRKPRRSPRVFAAEADACNAKLAHDVVYAVVLGSVVHRQPRDGDGKRVHFLRCEYVVPGNHGLLRKIVEVSAKARQVLRGRRRTIARREAIFRPDRIAAEQRVAAGKIVIYANRALVLKMRLVPHIEIIIRVRLGAHRHVRRREVPH